MNDIVKTLALSASGMEAQSVRLRRVSENIANVDTPGFHRKLTTFQAAAMNGDDNGRVEVGPVSFDQKPLKQIFDPAHPLADSAGYFEGSNVDLMIEIADARQAQRSYEANLKMFDQARKMTTGLLELLRK